MNKWVHEAIGDTLYSLLEMVAKIMYKSVSTTIAMY